MTGDSQSTPASTPPADPLVDTTVAQAARAYDYLLGGVNHFQVDVEMVERMYATAGGVEKARRRVRANRNFLGRAVQFLAGEAGIRQFLDLGTGIPNADNVHAVAHATAPDARVVYVDHDPVVLAHAHILRDSTSDPEGAAVFIYGDMRDHDAILAQAADTLDFSQPVAVVMVGVLHHFRDDEHPEAMVRHYVDAVPSESYLVLENVGRESSDLTELGQVMEHLPDAGFTLVPRSRAELARFFDGLELVEPGLVFVDDWRPDGPPPDYKTPHPCGVARKP
jgi:O-methyltransferase involved in polyketide biosynthesis